MNAIRNSRKSGFTLVEILIVVIILGILAAIVIPQFTNASQDARKSSLTSQLQTARSQIELYKLQHRDAMPTSLATGTATPWAEMTVKTNDDGTTTGTPQFGPYLQSAPRNPLNSNSAVAVVTADVSAGAAVTGTNIGFVFNSSNGKLWATNKGGTKVYDEANPNAATNDQ